MGAPQLDAAVLSSLRKSELKGRARPDTARGPNPSTVSFDDRTADRESHAHAIRLCRVEGVEQAVDALEAQSRAGITHRDEHPARWIILRPDHQFARSLADAAHRFDSVDDQVQDHLL